MSTPTSALSPSRPRAELVDAVRGVAFLAMFVYHAAWFADDARLVTLEMMSLPWRAFQRSIAGTFFFLVGVSLWLAAAVPARRALLRLGKVAGGAAIVTVTSVVLDPGRLVLFGVLHAIFLASVLGIVARRLGSWAVLPGLVLFPVGASVSQPVFDQPHLQWLGLGTFVPVTFDHQPFVMWFGVVLVGLGLAAMAPDAAWRLRGPRPLVLLGQHSLLLYMAHVPLLQGLMMGIQLLQPAKAA